jgi:hypothetical protein
MVTRFVGTRFVWSLVLACTVAACGVVEPQDGPVLVRAENATGSAMAQLELFFHGGPYVYEQVAAGGTTPYVQVDHAYKYVTMRALLNGEQTGLTVIDFVGEDRLPPGRYTYVFGLADGQSITLTLRRE